MYTLAIFDFDGVIIDSKALMIHAFSESYRLVLQKDDPPVDEYLSYSGDSFPRIMEKMGLPAELHPHFKSISMRDKHMLTVFPGIYEVLNTLHNNHISMSLVTGKDTERTLAILEEFGLRSFFKHVLCSDMVRYPKPNPESILKALAFFNARPYEAIMIGDSLSDIVAAKRANIKTIAVTWGLGRLEQLVGIESDHVVDHPEEILHIVCPALV